MGPHSCQTTPLQAPNPCTVAWVKFNNVFASIALVDNEFGIEDLSLEELRARMDDGTPLPYKVFPHRREMPAGLKYCIWSCTRQSLSGVMRAAGVVVKCRRCVATPLPNFTGTRLAIM